MKRNAVTSSQLRSVGYDPATGTLEIEFHPTQAKEPGQTNDPSVYQYAGVPQSVHDELVTAPSVGSYFIKHIKKGNYKYQRVQ